MVLLQKVFQSKVLRNSNWLLLGGVATAGISFVTTAFVARHLSVEDFGVVQFTLTCFFFIQQTESFIFPNVFKRVLVEQPEKKEALLRVTIQLMLLLSVVLSLAFLASYFVVNNIVLYFLALMSAGLIFRTFVGISYSMDIDLKSRITLSYNIFGLSAASVLRAVSSVVAPGVFLQIVATPLQFAISCIAHFIKEPLARKSLKNIGSVDKELWSYLLKASFGFFLVSLLSIVLFRIDTLLLGFMSTPEEVAHYSVAVKLSEPWLFIGNAISSSFFPILVRSRKQGPTRYYSYFSLLFWTLTISSGILALSVSIFAEPIMRLAFGTKYLTSADILRVHIWSVIPLFLYSLHHIWDVCEKLDTWAIQRSAFAAGCNVVLNLILIPRMGAMACAISSVITYFFYGYGFNIFHRRGRLLLKSEIRFLPRALQIIRTGGIQA